MDIILATNPTAAISDLWRLWQVLITNPETAASLLEILVGRGRTIGIQIFLEVENTELSLPEGHGLTSNILALDKVGQIYTMRKSGMVYCYQD